MDYFDSLYPFEVFVGLVVLCQTYTDCQRTWLFNLVVGGMGDRWQSSMLCQSLRRFSRRVFL
jgi:hypothetical protein